MKLTNKLRKVFLILLLSLITMGIGSEAEAAEFWDLNQASVFIKQGRSDTCTLASAVMMVRRAAMASGNANWASITENSMRSTAWLEGSGLYYNFTYAGISVKHGTLAGRDHVISLLNQHPEGIVIYNTSKPHAILLTDYTEGIFFCADPANNTIAGRIPIASASITLDSASQYWYVDSPKITLGPANNTVTFDSEVVNGISYNSAKISTWASSTGTITEMGFYAGTNLSSLGKYVTAKNVDWTRFHMEYEVANYAKLPAGSTIYYQFFVVNGGKEYKTSLNSFRTDDSPVSFDSEAITDISPDSAKISTWASSTGTITEMGFYVGTNSSSLGKYVTAKNVDWTRFHMEYEVANYAKLPAGSTIYYQFFVVNGGKEYKTSLNSFITKAHKHEYTSTIKKPATCTEPGIRLHTCKDNDDSYEEEIPATGHQHTELRNVKAATCAQEGYTGDTYCKDCNIKLTSGKVIPKKEHTWDSGKITTAATCSGKGIKTYTCTGCNATRTEEIPATGHQHTELRNVKAATCRQEGYTGDTYCKDCNTKLTDGKVIPKTEHTWDAGKITTVATCNGKGIKTYTCTGCNATRTEEIPATGHQHTELRNVKVATCTQEGYTGDTYCKDCNTKLTAGKVLPKTDHTWDDGKITTAATCSGKGIKIFTCTVCKSTRIEEIPATGHVNKITKFAKKASCKSEGYTGDVYCQDCGILIEEGKIIPKTEHVWNDGEITTPATCTTEGIKTYTCTSCGTTKTEAIAATGHGATEIRNKKDASATSEGYTGDTYCTICNQKISSGNTIAKLTPETATPGKTLKDKSTNGVYKVLQDGVSVEYTKPVYKKASVRIPDTINVNGITCKVTEISANAFKNNKSLKSVSIGRNVTVIGTNAFYGCKKLSKVNGGDGIVKIGHRAFANCSSLNKITIPGSVTSIGKQAFCNCKKLRSITIKTSTLSGETVGSKAFAGTYKKPTVKVPASQLKTYKKLLKARGMSSKAVYRK